MRSRGMRDLPPAEMDRVCRIEDLFATTCRAWGYREIRTPVIEPLHLFTAAGTLSPKMLDTVYSFLDWDGWSGERVVLRPDSTIPAARLYREHLDGVAKLFYRQNIFRFTDDGSSREEWQCGVELIGDTGVRGDVELLLLALETLAPLGLPPLAIRISHAEIVRDVLAATGMSADEQSRAYDRLLDGDLGVVEEIEARLPKANASLRLLFEVEGAGSAYVANLRAALAAAFPAVAQALDDLAFVARVLEARGVTPVVQAVLARSFEYYSGLVFKIYAGDQRICSGGRYDHLIGLIGERDVPASGFAHYVSPIAAMMPAEGSRDALRVRLNAATDEPRDTAAMYEAAAEMRRAGIIVESAADGALTGGTRVTVAADPLRFVLAREGIGTKELFDVASVVAELEQRP
jgi:histidyl-tRNA synthetase